MRPQGRNNKFRGTTLITVTKRSSQKNSNKFLAMITEHAVAAYWETFSATLLRSQNSHFLRTALTATAALCNGLRNEKISINAFEICYTL